MYVVKDRAIITKTGVKSKGDVVTARDIGKNWSKLINLGWIEKIIKESEIIEEIKDSAEDVEIIEEKPVKKSKKDKKKNNKEIIIGAVKKDESIIEEEAIEKEIIEDESEPISGE